MSLSLDGLVGQYPEMGPAAATVRALATALPDISLPDGVPHLGAAEVRLAAGVAALDGEPLLSGSALLANLRTLTLTLHSTVAARAAEALPDALEQGLGGADLDELAAAAQAGAWEPVAALAAGLGLDPDLLITLVDHASRPALRSGARAVHDLVGRGRWSHGTCPACGAAPILAESHAGGASGSGEQERVLRCGRCLTGWPFPRLRCVACGESNHGRLAYLHGSGEGAFRRADVCSTCRTYLKSIAVLAPLTLSELLELDLATAALDIAAVQRGFHR